MNILTDILLATWGMALAAAPWLVVGLVVAALIKVYVPTEWLTKFLHGRGGVVKAAFIGAPLPLCSCGVIPAALALRRQGASRGAVMSFLVATPETGVDSVAVSYALLGPWWFLVAFVVLSVVWLYAKPYLEAIAKRHATPNEKGGQEPDRVTNGEGHSEEPRR